MDWYYASGGQQQGPVSDAELEGLVRAGAIMPSTLVWNAGLTEWQPWSSIARQATAPIPPYPVAPARFVYAGFWIRFLAYLIDGAVIQLIRSLLLLPLGMSMFDRPYASPWYFTHMGEAQLSSFAISLCYFVFFWTQYGATPGKMVLKLKIVNPDGGPLTIGQAAGRYLSTFLSGIILCIGFMMAGWDDEKRALHDRLADTRVIRLNEITPLRF